MSKQYYKFLLYSLYLGALICGFYLLLDHYREENRITLAPRTYDSTIINQNTSFVALNNNPLVYEIPFLRIRYIGFKAEKDCMYFKFQLAGTLPEDRDSFPSYENDKIIKTFYSLRLDENYFDFEGNKNPGGPEANLTINFYESNQGLDNTKINLQGELVKGGPGFDFFIVRFPYSQLLVHQNSEFIVFTAEGQAASEKFPDGAAKNEFENSTLAATKSNNKEILLDWTLKDLRY